MKKVILNARILDLDGNVIVSQSNLLAKDDTGKVIVDKQGQPVRLNTPITFGKIVLDALVRSQTRTDEETGAKYAFAQALKANLLKAEPTEMEVAEGDGTANDASIYAFIKSILVRQPLIIKARFNDMIEALNKAV